MVVKIDYRESKLISTLESTPHTVENLLLGDVSIHLDTQPGNEPEPDAEPAMILERKTVPDMLASIKDGRYLEQKARLDASPVPNHNIVFVIEGPRAGVPHLHAAVFSLLYYSGFGVIFTTSVSDTARIVSAFDRKLNKDPCKIPYYRDQHSTSTPKTSTEYAAILKPEKKANVCRENAWIIMLQQLPFVSSTIAAALMNQFDTVPAMLDILREDPAALDGFKMTGTDGKSRKLSSRAIATIRDLLV